MSFSQGQKYMIDLANDGDYVDIDVSRLPGWTVRVLDIADWGNAVVEIQKLFGSITHSYSTAKELSVAGVDIHENTTDEQTQSIRLVVTTPDTAKGHGRIMLFGKETQ